MYRLQLSEGNLVGMVRFELGLEIKGVCVYNGPVWLGKKRRDFGNKMS